MSKIFVKPKKGVQIIDPISGQALPEDGAEIVMTTYYKRRLNDGDITLSTPPSRRKSNKGDK